jgi:EAL domain-containing protein (putative c-di-GMP-specific phosphodiesterase class I)
MALATHQLPANSLTLEITETTAMSDADASMTVLQQLSDMGVDLSIDDFGTGYSSLMYLKRLPANELKIDRGFVRDLEHDSDDAAIVSAIVALGQALGLRIVAEGVETGMQQDFLTQLGCDSLQVTSWGIHCRPSVSSWKFTVRARRRLIGGEGTRSLAISNGNRPMQKPKRRLSFPRSLR